MPSADVKRAGSGGGCLSGRTLLTASVVAVAAVAVAAQVVEPPFFVAMIFQPAASNAPELLPAGPPLASADHTLVPFNPLFESPEDAQEVVDFAMRRGRFPQYMSEESSDDFGDTTPAKPDGSCPLGLTRTRNRTAMECRLAQRFDAGTNYVLHGGPNARRERVGLLTSRTAYFRDVYAYGSDVAPEDPIVEKLMAHPGLAEGARKVYGDDKCAIVKPYIVFANIMLFGQELAVHVDVPEFIGADRKTTPQWLLAVMHLSGLFDHNRLRIATGVSWWHNSQGGGNDGGGPADGGGAFVAYPSGPLERAFRHNVQFNTAMVLDTDSVYHGVDTVTTREDRKAYPPFDPGMRLERRPESGDTSAPPDASAPEWVLLFPESDEIKGRYSFNDMRYSVSWKAYCFADEAEQQRWRRHRDGAADDGVADEMSLDNILRKLLVDLIKRKRLPAPRVNGTTVDVAQLDAATLRGMSLDDLSSGLARDRVALAGKLVSEYVVFPRESLSPLHALRVWNWCTGMDLLPGFLGDALGRLLCNE